MDDWSDFSRRSDLPRRQHNSGLRQSRALRAIGSLKLAVLLMLSIGAAMAVATIVESRLSRIEAQMYVYQSWWFGVLLLTLGVNIFAATLARWPFPLRRIGFPITHLGILVIMAGALITNRLGLEGQLRLVERGTSDRVSLGSYAIGIGRRQSTGLNATDILLPMDSLRPKRGLGSSQSISNPELKIKFLDFISNCRWDSRYESAESGPAAIGLILRSSEAHEPQTTWLTSASPILVPGELRIELAAATDGAALRRQLESNQGHGSLRVRSGEREQKIEIDTATRGPVSLEGGPSIRVTGFFPDAAVGDDRRLVSRSSEPRNPAVEIELSGPQGAERRIAFAKYPQFAEMHANQWKYADVKIGMVGGDEAGPGSSLRLIPSGDGLYFRAAGPGGTTNGRVNIGEQVAPHILGLPMAISTYLPHARLIEEPVAITHRDDRTDEPAVRVEIASGNKRQSEWLHWQQPTSMELGDQTYHLVLRNSQFQLPFVVRLDRFERETYPGTNQAAMFASHVTLIGGGNEGERPATIRMNQPLKLSGYTLFQSGFQNEGPRTTSILTVSHDPGKWPVYGGFALVCFGVVLMVLAKRGPRVQAARAVEGKSKLSRERVPCAA